MLELKSGSALTAEWATRCKNGSNFGLTGSSSSSSCFVRSEGVPSILRFLVAAALAMAAFDTVLAVGDGAMEGVMEDPPLGCMPLAFIRRS